MEFLASLGLWNWVIIGCILLILELVVPGVFLLWLGVAAIITAIISSVVGDYLWLGSWQGQVVLFLILSVISVYLGKRYFYKSKNDEPLLNNRTDQLIGQIATLNEPIENGHGRVRVDDTIWRVTGPDLVIGTKVQLKRFHNGAFEVDKIS